MCNLLHYFVGGLAVLFALDYAAPPGGTGVNVFRQSSFDLATAPTMNSVMNVVDRAHKSNRLAAASPGRDQDTVIATVEVSGLRDAAVGYRARSGRVLFHTDPLANATVVAKGVVLPEVTIRDTGATSVGTLPTAFENVLSPPSRPSPVVPATTAREPKILEGCDSAFSSLASVRANFSTRCLASNAPATRVASALP